MNKVNLIGNVGTVIFDNAKDDTQTCLVISLATSEKWIDKSNNEVVKTEWHKVTVFGKMAVSARPLFVKGQRLFIEGKLRYTEYENEQKQIVKGVDILCLSYLASK